jgi:hypothetical protein
MTIKTYGTDFTSYDVKANQKTKEEISNEKVSFDETVKQTNEVADVVYHTTTQIEGAKPTTFIDPVTKKYVIASLENETLDKLRGKFGSDNVVEKEDGSIRLIGDAEAFTSGWFADIAYNREFLMADTNSDGQLTEDEYNNTWNDFGIENQSMTEFSSGEEKLLFSGEKIIQSYGNASNDVGYRNYREFDIATSLDDELNTTLQGDVDFDGKMTLKEAYNTNGNSAKDIVLRHLKEWGISTVPSELDTSDFDHLLNFVLDIFLQKDKKEQEKIMQKMYDNLENGKEPTKEMINQFYTEENLEQIKKLKVTNKENRNATLEVYS